MKFDFDAEFFNIKQVLDCGQIFRYYPLNEGYIGGYAVFSADKACIVYPEGNKIVVDSDYPDYFYDYFDLSRDYSEIIKRATSHNISLLTRSAQALKGLRLLNQNPEEMLYSFIISQNNNIPRIKGIISRICMGLGENRSFIGGEYYTFPTSRKLASAGEEFFRSVGCGYRDKYLAETSQQVLKSGLPDYKNLTTAQLKKELLAFKGVGGKVADCIALFGFGKRDSFPVDTWIEKVYREDFAGSLTDRNKITAYFCDLFGDDAGYIQQYLFYGKRLNL